MKNESLPLLSVEEVWARMQAEAVAVADCERVTLDEALSRVLAEDLRAPITVPGFDNSAMDGYAFRADDARGRRELPISLRVAAGDPPGKLSPGTACRIFTGAPVPAGADTVVIQEHCERRGDTLVLPEAWTPHANIRRAGEDIRAGDVILQAGARLSPQAVGLAASCGFSEVLVRRRLRVAILSTGNELKTAGLGPLNQGQIYDSNRPMLHALLAHLGCEIQAAGPVSDDVAATCEALRAAAQAADVIFTTGGVSVGEEDHVKTALEAEGTLALWRVAIKPGKPLAFGRVGAAHFVGLPGNPVSAFVTFLLFAQPFLKALMGQTPGPLRGFPVRAAFMRATPDKRREFLRARLTIRADGALWAEAYPRQSSGVLSSTVWADGLVDIAAGRTVAEGEAVPFLPFEGLGC
ncbi:gephyrin-like molybdotransferase Glp [Acidiferrobacter sp.]|uniref:molybdopterin molybdotransferase MoeA n=1 Tax=Acidiferrobacter sp. TaxID=1872107 RepID=UPI002601D577|nr:gephyrin-like molybdotransferase Glp [Acidiferrobacter sp.]